MTNCPSTLASTILLVLVTCTFSVYSSPPVTASGVLPYDPTQCPTWFVPDINGKGCRCGNGCGGLKCYVDSNRTVLQSQHCMTFDNVTKLTLVGPCPFNLLGPEDYSNVEVPRNISELNTFMCGGLNRTGVFCSHCEPGLGTPLLSYDVNCLECLHGSRGWLLYTFLACVPSTVLFISLLFFQVRATSAPMNCFIFLAQTFSLVVELLKQTFFHGHVDSSHSLDIFVKALATFYGFWTLDFFRLVLPEFCASCNVKLHHALALEYVVAVYPLVLLAVVYLCIQKYAMGSKVLTYLWAPFRVCFTRVQRVWDPSRSLVHVFSTFLILAYFKVAIVSVILLTTTKLTNNLGVSVGRSTMTYYNASIPYFGREHAPFGILAIFMFVAFNVVPVLFLFLYPCRVFQSCLNCCKIRSHALHVFADSFNGCYKNGCGGTRDHRWFAGYYLFFRSALLLATDMLWKKIYLTCLFTSTFLVILLTRPYKDDWFNFLDFFLFLSLGMTALAGCAIRESGGSIQGILAFGLAIPFFYFALYLTARIVLYTGVLDRHRYCQKVRSLLQRATADFGAPPMQGGSASGQTPGNRGPCRIQRGQASANSNTQYGAI